MVGSGPAPIWDSKNCTDLPPVVLRRDEDEARVLLDLEGPGAGMGLLVVGGGVDAGGDCGLVEEGEGVGGEVDGVVGVGKGWGCDGGAWRSDCGFGAWRSVVVVREGCLLIVEMTKSATCGLTRG